MPIEFNEEGKINLEGLGENHQEEINNYAKDYANKNWRDLIPEELSTDGVMANISDLNMLAKNYKNAQTKISQKGIIPPGENASDEEWGEFYKQLGRPDEVTGYEYEQVEGFDNEDFMQKFSDIAHKNGLNGKQAKAAMKFIQDTFIDNQSSAQTEYKNRVETEWNDLQKEMGSTFEDNKKKVGALLTKYADEETREWFKNSGISNESKMFKMLSDIAKDMSEDSIGSMETKPTNYGPKEALSKANDIMSNKNNSLNEPYLNREHPRHKEAVDEVTRLFKMAYPE